MGSLTKKDVEHVAKLAKLTLTSGEVTKFQEQLSKIVNYIGQLEEVDTSELLSTSQTTGLENVFRIDEVKTSSCLSQDGYFIVDRVIPTKSGDE